MFTRIFSLILLSVFLAAAAGQEKTPKTRPPKIDPKATYECLLGAYANEGKSIPFVNLDIPDGSNMLTDKIVGQMRGKISLGEISYKASGYIVIPRESMYEFDHTFGSIKLNGKELVFDRKPTSMVLKEGTYQITLYEPNHGQPYLQACKIKITDKSDGTKIPIVNSGRDMQAFVSTPIAAVAPQMVTPFNLVERQVKAEKKGRKKASSP
jgi:hypothetical protein